MVIVVLVLSLVGASAWLVMVAAAGDSGDRRAGASPWWGHRLG
jgi:hypothetical protein